MKNNFRTFNADIIYLQETHNDSEYMEKQWTKEWGGLSLWSRGTNRSYGVAILLKPGLECSITHTLRDHEGPLKYQDIELNLMNIYAPNIQENGNLSLKIYGNTKQETRI